MAKGLLSLRAVRSGVLIRVLGILLLAGASLSGIAHAAPTKNSPPPSPPPAAAAPSSVWQMDTPGDADLQKSIAETQKGLEGIPKDATDKSNDGQKRLILKQRLDLLGEWREQLRRMAELRDRQKQSQGNTTDLQKLLHEEQIKPPPAEPAQPTPEGFNRIKEEVARYTQDVEVLLTESKERHLAIQDGPRQVQQAQERQRTAQEDARRLQDMLARGNSKDNKAILTMRIDNARLLDRVSAADREYWEAAQGFSQENMPLRDRQLELARMRLRRAEHTFALYQEALNRQQAKTVAQMESAVTAKEKAAAEAGTPDQRFLAAWEADASRIQKSLADLNKLKTDVISAVSDQEGRLQKERDELKNLELVVRQSGVTGRAATLLKETFGDVAERRRQLRQMDSSDLVRQLNALPARNAEIDMLLAGLFEQWRTGLDGLDKTLELPKTFMAQAEQLLNNTRTLLEEEKRLAFDVISEGRRLQFLPGERRLVLDDLERFVLSRVFWIRDDTAIGLETADKIIQELGSATRPYSLVTWLQEIHGGLTDETLIRSLQTSTAIAYSLTLFALLPLVLYRTRTVLRHKVRTALKQAHAGKPEFDEQMRIVGIGLLSSALLPVYLSALALALSLEVVTLPAYLGPVLQAALLHVALVIALWRISRLVISSQGVGVVLFGLPAEAATNLHNASRSILLAYLVLIAPWMLFHAEPFHFSGLSRLGYTLFEIVVVVAIYRLIRPSAPLARALLGWGAGPATRPGTAWRGMRGVARHWRWISPMLLFGMTAIVVLDIVGFRFGAAQLARNGLLSFITVLVLFGIYYPVASTVDRLLRHHRRMVLNQSAAERAERSVVEGRTRIASQVRRTIRVLFVLCGTLLLISYWGINERALTLLSEYTLYNVTLPGGEVGFVTLADLAFLVLILLGTLWLMRQLPRVYELLLFPRMGAADEGVRYAVLTISRYLMFLVGFFTAISFLKLDLSQLGWLVAAVSVGIGFGLQEIVANFVSGVILLLERPIRVGDMITVGAITGRVTRINIRATTILNDGLQELLVPNRDLITKDVTNWTLASSNLRLVIRLGVAYGSDIAQVRDLLETIARAQPEVLQDPPVEVYFIDHGESALLFEVRLCLPNPLVRMKVRDRINTRINEEFTRAGIGIPFPQRELHLRLSSEQARGLMPVADEASTDRTGTVPSSAHGM